MEISILIVDDFEYVREVIAQTMIERGHKVVGMAANGKEGVEAYNKYKPDIVLLDLHMPVMDGIETLKRIKKIDDAAKVIVVSALGQGALVSKAMSLGAADYIVKPLLGDDLEIVIKKVNDAIFFSTEAF